jgi:hypothetical protein
VAVLELGSPLVARAQADDAAHEIANEVSFQLRDDFTTKTLETSCQIEATKQHVTAVCDFDRASNEVVVDVEKEARSFLLKNFGPTKDWYVVEASARADRR